MDYVVFNVLFIVVDFSVICDILVVKIFGFIVVVDGDFIFVFCEEGIIIFVYFSKDDLSIGIVDIVMNMFVGSVYGLYVESGEYCLVKVIDCVVMVDFVDICYIFLSV